MIKFLNDIRNVEKPISNNRKIINTIAVLFLGIALGTFSKFLDFRQAELPSVLMAIDGALDVFLKYLLRCFENSFVVAFGKNDCFLIFFCTSDKRVYK